MNIIRYAASLYRNRAGKIDDPRMLTFLVTMRCNARCRMCDSWKIKGTGELTLDQIDKIFSQLPRLDLVRLSGGEPFLRKDISEIIELSQSKLQPILLHMTTNGLLTDTIINALENRIKRIPLYLLVSLDGIGEKHNRIRGVSNAWERAMETINAIAPRKKKLNVIMGINQTILDNEGVADYEAINQMARERSIEHHCVIAYDVSATYNIERDKAMPPKAAGSFSPFGNLDPKTTADFLRRTRNDTKYLPFSSRLAKRYYLHGMEERLAAKTRYLNPPCVAVNSHIRLSPDGTIPVCQFNSQTIGDLTRQPFNEVWRGKKAQESRSWVRNCAGCWAECEVLPNALYSGDIIKTVLR